ncbi:MAG: VWA domain-containing protein [Anaerolineae bacterium]
MCGPVLRGFARALRLAAWTVPLVLLATSTSTSRAAGRLGERGESAPLLAAASETFAYRLVDTWRDSTWALTPGRYGEVGDISSAPDGTIYVLDTRHGAVHVAGPDGAATRVFELPEPSDSFGDGEGHRARRLDVGPDGLLHVLTTAPADPLETATASWVEILDGYGRRRSGFAVARGYNDVAASAGGTVYLSRSQPLVVPTPEPRQPAEVLPGGIDEFEYDGRMVSVIEDESVFYAMGVDVAADGTVYVVNRVPSPWDYERPGPQPTPRPALDAAPDQIEHGAIEGIVVFGPDHAYRETVAFTTPEDVSVGRAGVFVSRNVEIFALGADEPLYEGPPGQLVVGFYDGLVLHLDAPADGRLLGGMAHCFFQGVLRIDAPWAVRIEPRYVGALDAPHLEGPVHPLRLDAGADVSLLGGRFAIAGQRPEQAYRVVEYSPEPQSVQRWAADGRLRSQLGLCAGSVSVWRPDRSDAAVVLDVASDGADVYTVDPLLVRRRPDDLLPAWSFWPGALLGADARAHLRAVSASAGRVAVLDAGGGRVHVLRDDGSLEATWPLVAWDAGGPATPESGAAAAIASPADIALAGSALYVADGGAARVARYSLAGELEDVWSTSVSPYRMAADDSGDVYVLGRGGWAQRLTPSGAARASWSMPRLEPDPVDIAVGDDGRVYVAYERRVIDPDTGRRTSEIAEAGVWVFDSMPSGVGEPDVAGRCLADVDKWAEPGLVRLGDEVEVTLQVRGWCPGAYDPVQLVLLVDTSRSMNWHEALDMAKTVALTVIESLDPEAAEIALITFDDEASLHVPLTRDHASVAASLARLEAYGDSHMAAGIAAAHAELTGERSDPTARRLVLVISDGEYTDKAADAAAPARDDGVEFHAVALPHGGISTYFYALQLVTDSEERVLVAPDDEDVRRLARSLVHYGPTAGAFESLAIDDVVPANMRYVQGSAEPAASYDGTTLGWRVGAVSATDTVELRYRLEPLETGEWPTNVTAMASYEDALGELGRRAFPVPSVRVWDSSTLGNHVYLPLAAARSCFRSGTAIDAVIVLDTSRSMDDPAGGGRTKLEAARAAAEQFVGLLREPGDRVAVVAFNDRAEALSALSADHGQAIDALGRLVTAPGTRIDRGLAAARTVIAEQGAAGAQPVIVVLTDGLQGGDPAAVSAEAVALRRSGVLVFAIGLGADVDDDLLRAVATTPEDYLPSPTADDLEQAFRRVIASLACRVE